MQAVKVRVRTGVRGVYLGHILSEDGIAKGKIVDAVKSMPDPQSVTELGSFLGSVQFYGKFIPNLATLIEPFARLTRKGVAWTWGNDQKAAFATLKSALRTDNVLAQFDPKETIGVSCDASDVGIGAVLFHRYADARSSYPSMTYWKPSAKYVIDTILNQPVEGR